MEKFYDLSPLHEICEGDERFIKEMVKVFAENTKKVVAEMEKQVDEGNRTQLRKLAHSIKSNMHTYGVPQAYEILKEIEMQADQDDMPALKQKVMSLGKITGKAIEQMETDFNIS